MRTVMLLLLCVYSASAEKHSQTVYAMLSSGIPNIPEYKITASVDDVVIGYYDGTIKILKHQQEWVQEMLEMNPQHWERLMQRCTHHQQVLKTETQSFQSEGASVIQQISGCDWDDETGKLDGFRKYAYNGENFLSFDEEAETWIASNPRAETIKEEWNKDKIRNTYLKNSLTPFCLEWLKICLNFSKRVLHRKDLPSVSLLQKSPSSPVTCHATGFYPNKAAMMWRKDGEEIHEGVELGELLQNQDETFQISTELNISSIPPNDWSHYECVFQLFGVKSDFVAKLDKSQIRTNFGKMGIRNNDGNLSGIGVTVIAVVVVLVVLLIPAVGFFLYKKKKDKKLSSSDHGNIPELSERLKPEPETGSTNTSQ